MKHVTVERLQAMLDFANARAIQADCIHRLQIRVEVAQLQNAERINILRCLGGDLV
jgi:hypothetical protein